MDASEALNAALLRATEQACARTSHVSFFMGPVSTAVVTDYHTYVDAQEEIYIAKILQRIEQQQYCSVADYRRDITSIYFQARAYNTAGKHAYEPVIHWSRELLLAVEEELAALGGALAALEQEVQQSLLPQEEPVSAATTAPASSSDMANGLRRPSALNMRDMSCTGPSTINARDASYTGCCSVAGTISPYRDGSLTLSPGSSSHCSGLEALLAACELAAVQECRRRSDDASGERARRRASEPCLAVPSIKEEQSYQQAGADGGEGAARPSLPLSRPPPSSEPQQQQQQRQDGDSPTAFGAAGAVAGAGCSNVLGNAFKHRRHKSKVFIKPNKVVYLPTTFVEEEFNVASLPLDCQLLVEADGTSMPEAYQVTIKAVPRQGLSTMYCMTNVMRFQQRYLNWQIINWTRINDGHIKIHVLSPPAPVKQEQLGRTTSMPEVPKYRRSEEGFTCARSSREGTSLKRKSDMGHGHGQHHYTAKPPTERKASASADGSRLDLHCTHRPSPIPESPTRSPAALPPRSRQQMQPPQQQGLPAVQAAHVQPAPAQKTASPRQQQQQPALHVAMPAPLPPQPPPSLPQPRLQALPQQQQQQVPSSGIQQQQQAGAHRNPAPAVRLQAMPYHAAPSVDHNVGPVLRMLGQTSQQLLHHQQAQQQQHAQLPSGLLGHMQQTHGSHQLQHHQQQALPMGPMGMGPALAATLQMAYQQQGLQAATAAAGQRLSAVQSYDLGHALPLGHHSHHYRQAQPMHHQGGPVYDRGSSDGYDDAVHGLCGDASPLHGMVRSPLKRYKLSSDGGGHGHAHGQDDHRRSSGSSSLPVVSEAAMAAALGLCLYPNGAGGGGAVSYGQGAHRFLGGAHGPIKELLSHLM